MAFSSFTLGEGVCSSSDQSVLLPTCPLLTFDLALLHLLSTATLALLLVILSNTLSPSYYASLSNLSDVSQDRGKAPARGGSVLVMWELAVHSPPSSPRLLPAAGSSGYGATDATVSTPTDGAIVKRDRFAEGRVVSYSLLLLASLGVAISAALLMGLGEFGESQPAAQIFKSVGRPGTR